MTENVGGYGLSNCQGLFLLQTGFCFRREMPRVCGNECKVVALARQVFLFYPMLLDTAGFSKMVQWPSEVLSERTWLVMCLLVADFKTQSKAQNGCS